MNSSEYHKCMSELYFSRMLLWLITSQSFQLPSIVRCFRVLSCSRFCAYYLPSAAESRHAWSIGERDEQF